MTKKLLITLAASLLLNVATAYSQEEIRVAVINSAELLEAFPEKKKSADQLITLSDNYKKELELMQNEYNKKYSDYITYQASLAENIKLRRMQELTALESRLQQFMELAQQDIENKEKEFLEPLKEKIKEAIYAVGVEQGFTVVYDLANPGIAFVSPNAINANSLVKQKLGIK